MTFENALRLAEKLAESLGVELGQCIFSQPIGDDWWAFNFDIAFGSSDRCWAVIVTADANKSVIFEMRQRPSPVLRPTIKRRWWFFGERQERLPIGQISN